MKKGTSNGCLITALKILGIIILIPLLIAFGWIAGAIWLLFFRKKLNDNPEKQKKLTIIVSVLSALSLIVMIFSIVTYKPLKSIEISSDMSGQELEINQDYIIDVTYEPENASNSDFIYNIDNFCATFEKSGDDNGKAVLHTKSEGTVTISVSNGEINSNSLEFTIIDTTKDTEDADKEDEKDKKTENDDIEEPTEPTESSSEIPPKVINDDVDITFSESIHNDTTNNWRLARVATPKEIQEYALEYYNSYFQSDSEIHAIVNFTLNTTNKLTKITSDTLDVFVYDYVDKEELDAKALFTGTPLANYEINISTGEITEIPLETNDTKETNPADTAAEPISDNTDTAAETVNEAEPENPPESSEMVWLSATGDNYHSIPNCGKMNPDKASQVSKEQAESSGHNACSKCY